LIIKPLVVKYKCYFTTNFLFMAECFELFLNYFELNFSPPRKDEWDISEDFDYHRKPFVITKWVYEEVKIYTSDEDIKKQIIFNRIINTYYEKAKVMKLDYLQKLKVNRDICRLIDNWTDICLMYPTDY